MAVDDDAVARARERWRVALPTSHARFDVPVGDLVSSEGLVEERVAA